MISNSAPAASSYARAVEPEPSVTITDATFFGHGWQPMTIATLQAIWFMPQGIDFKVEDLTAWFRKLGWKSGNGQPIGIDAVRRELALIRQAGYVHAVRVRGQGGRVEGIRYEVSKRVRAELPAAGPWIPIQAAEPESRRSHQVPSITEHGGPPGMADGEKPSSRHVPPSAGDGGWAKMASGSNLQVAPSAPIGVSPPHPPEEVDTSSPYPLNQSAAPTEEEADQFTPDEIQAAEHYLQLLPAPWAVGRKTAQRLAPLLLEAVTAQGWDLDDDLRAQLTSNPDGIKRHASVLEKERIADLPLRAAMAKPTAGLPQPAAAAVSLPAWCEDLDCDEDTRERTITDAKGYRRTGPCPDCHPANSTRQEAA